MDGVGQTVYPRKNWSSVMLWNCHHPSNLMFGIDDVNNKPGSWLHGFGWLAENEIGELPKEWNWLEGWDKPGETLPAIIHYTRPVLSWIDRLVHPVHFPAFLGPMIVL